MKNKLNVILFVLSLSLVSAGMVGANEYKHFSDEKNHIPRMIDFSNDYGIQWEQSYGSNPWNDARYEGPQPIGDCDNDGDNELLIGGRDAVLRVM